MIDIHSHILPGLDDGPWDREKFVAMMRIAADEGITDIIATPHIIPGIYDNHRENIKTAVEEAKQILLQEKIMLNIYGNAEHFLDEVFYRQIKKDVNIVQSFGKYILIELPMNAIPAFTYDVIFQLQLSGFIPIIAHPERNRILASKPYYIYDLVSKGVLMQLNAGSLLGQFGARAKELSEIMLTHNWVHFIATDAHSTCMRPPLLRKPLEVAKSLIGDRAYRLVYDNPQMLLRGEIIVSNHIKEYQQDNPSFWRYLKNLT